jgi:hypothetical protein
VSSPTEPVRLSEGENHLISARGRLAFCEVWSRPDLTPEQGADSAKKLSDYLTGHVLAPGSAYTGLVFDLRRGPPAFGPKTREALSGFFAAAARANIGVAVLIGDAPLQMLQFRTLCRESGGRADVFNVEDDALHWLGGERAPVR